MIVALLTLSLWHCDQYYCWRFMPLQLLMWLIHINRKVGCHLGDIKGSIVAINRCCRFLRSTEKIQ
jgi:hypothetical protein